MEDCEKFKQGKPSSIFVDVEKDYIKSVPPKIFSQCKITDWLVSKPHKQAQLGRNVALGD
jgi:hypothetical protein